ncbi:MAG: type II toxin-antitoxin system VapC family toxin [Chloroflexota bacterium]
MSADVVYLDTSAFVKTVNQEPESDRLRSYLQGWERFASSALLRLETVRALSRLSPELVALGRTALRHIDLVAVDDAVLDLAELLEPPGLRSLDAIHLATARMLGASLGVIASYDERLLSGAVSLGLPAVSP